MSELTALQPWTASVPAQCSPPTKLDSTRLSVFDLPGEIRNNIFKYLLLSHQAGTMLASRIKLFSRQARGPFHNHDNEVSASYIQDLAALSLVCRQARIEPRTFFFGNNRFLISIDGMDLASEYVRFLDVIEYDGRSNLTSLEMERPSIPRSLRACPKGIYIGLFHVLRDCTNLQTLTLSVHLEYFLDCAQDLDDNYAASWSALKRYLYDNGPLPQFYIGGLVSLIRDLGKDGHLQCLSLICIYEIPKAGLKDWQSQMRYKGWRDVVQEFLLKQLRPALPHGEVQVKVISQVALSGDSKLARMNVGFAVEIDNRLVE